MSCRRNVGCLLFLLFIVKNCPSAWSYSIGFDYSGGVGISGWSTEGRLDLGPREAPQYELSLNYAQQHTTFGTESKSHQYALGFSHPVSDDLESHASLTY